jgi:hypothetical protein
LRLIRPTAERRKDAKFLRKKMFPIFALLASWRDKNPSPSLRLREFARVAQILKYSSTKDSGKGGLETRPYDFVIFASFVVTIFPSSLAAAQPRHLPI